MARELRGKPVAEAINQKTMERAAAFHQRVGRHPTLHVVLVGEDPASRVYVGKKQQVAEKLGLKGHLHYLPAQTSQVDLEEKIKTLIHDPSTDALLVQLPLPAGLNAEPVLDLIPADKDADGFHPANLGKLLAGRPSVRACTPDGIMQLLEHYQIPLRGQHAVVVGRSLTVGKPIAALLLNADATVTICHSKTPNLTQHLKQADLIIMAAGKPEMLTPEMISDGTTVIDVGIHRKADGSLCGDCHPSVAEKAQALSPVPGGVGPLTIATLMANTLSLAESLAEARFSEAD